MIRKPFELAVDFAAGGTGEAYTLDGWSRPERQYTWNNGHAASLVLPKLFDADRYDLSLDVWPFVVPGRLPVQRIEVIVRGIQVMQAAVDNRERRVIGCEIPPPAIDGCESVDVTFHFPDAAAPAAVTDDSSDRRIAAFAFFGLKLSGRLVGDQATTPEETESRGEMETQEETEADKETAADKETETDRVTEAHRETEVHREAEGRRETEVTQNSAVLLEPARLRLIDVGAMGGIQQKWQSHLGAITPVLFEPNPTEAAALRAQLPYAIVVEAALSNVTGRRNLVITENPTCISLRHPNQEFLTDYGINPHLRVIGTQEVQCTRYDVLHQQGRVPIPDAIKLDVQGCEYEVLLGFGALLQDCLGIELETHFYPLYREQRLLHEIIALLGEYGFVLRKLDQNKMDNFEGDLVEVDAFFTKPRAIVGTYDQVQRRKFDLLTEVWRLARYRL